MKPTEPLNLIVEERRGPRVDHKPALTRYLDDLRRVPRLTPEQEAGLCRLLAFSQAAMKSALAAIVTGQGDPRAHLAAITQAQDVIPRCQKLLAQDCLVMVVALAKRVPERGRLELIDLIAAGNDGLLKAAASYDPTRGARMSTWAFSFVRGAFYEALRLSSRLTKLSRADLSLLSTINKARWSFVQANQRHPTEGELVSLTSLPAETIRRVLLAAEDTKSLDDPDVQRISADSGPQPDEIHEHGDIQTRLNALVATLPKREGLIVRWHHGIGEMDGPQTFKQIGVRLGSTTGKPLGERRVRQLYQQALTKLRKRPELAALLTDQREREAK